MILHPDLPIALGEEVFSTAQLCREKRLKILLDGKAVDLSRVLFVDADQDFLIESEHDLEGKVVLVTSFEPFSEYISKKLKQGKIQIFIDGVLQ